MRSDWAVWLTRWTDAGLIDPAAAERIQSFESGQAGTHRLRWPILIALAFGALMIGGGVLLFVAANWDILSPSYRFTLVLLLVSIFHLAGAGAASNAGLRSSTGFPAMSHALHGIGTVALGAGIALSGQIFHLDEHWPAGILMWAIGAVLAWAVLRHTTQLALVALLVPAWLIGEWAAVAQSGMASVEVPAAGVVLLALTYLAAVGPAQSTPERRTLMWIGAIVGTFAAITLAAASTGGPRDFRPSLTRADTVGLMIGIGGPLLLAAFLRGRDAWPNVLAAAWVAALILMPGLDRGVATFGWWALGAIGLVAWGMRDGRVERINLGAAGFAAIVLAFYFSRVMDKLGRAAFLLILGLLFLGGGWALERMRRQLVARSRETR